MSGEFIHGDIEISRKRIQPNVTQRKKKVLGMSLSQDVPDGTVDY